MPLVGAAKVSGGLQAWVDPEAVDAHHGASPLWIGQTATALSFAAFSGGLSPPWPFHSLFWAFHRLSLDFHHLSWAFHRLSLGLHRPSPPFAAFRRR